MFSAEYVAEATSQAMALEAFRSADPSLDWTVVTPPPMIAPGERTGAYCTGLESPAGDEISAEDYAVALLDEVERPQHQRQRFTVASPA